ncbi:MAG: PQQ-binding-like beta-propeller repeat protein [Deltaproteobacteria bacterium]|nr:PQQ-binding-like beta-propeller repeat protein [Deltaproteobacteria bacterium]
MRKIFFILFFLLVFTTAAKANCYVNYRIAPALNVTHVTSVGKVGKVFPAVDRDFLYIGNKDGRFYKIDWQKHDVVWKIKLNAPIESSALCFNDDVFIGDDSGTLYCIDKSSGKIKWMKQFDFPILGKIEIHQNQIFLCTEDNSVWCISPKGEILFGFHKPYETISVRGVCSPVFDKDFMYVGFNDGYVYKVNLYTGNEEWGTFIGQGEKFFDVDGAIFVSRDVVSAASCNGWTVALDKKRGNIIWKCNISSYAGVVATPVFLVVPTKNGEIVVLDLCSGEKIWRLKVSYKPICAFVVVTRDIIYVLTQEGKIVVIDEDGKIINVKKLGGGFNGGFSISENGLFTVNEKGKVFVIGE